MRSLRYLLAFAFVIATMPLLAQDSVDNSPESTEPPQRSERFLVDVTWDGLLDAPDSMGLKLWSRGINLYGMYDIPLGSGKVSFGLGGGFSSSNYFSDGYFQTTKDSLGVRNTRLRVLSSDSSYKRNKLSVNYVDAAGEIRFRIKPKNSENAWKFALGARVGYLVNVHSKLVTDDLRYKDFDHPNITQWRYGATFRVGYGKVNLFGAYSISKLFEEDKGPDLTPITVGISLAPF